MSLNHEFTRIFTNYYPDGKICVIRAIRCLEKKFRGL